MLCFRCDYTFDSSDLTRCPKCHWSGTEPISTESEAYLIFVSLVYRVQNEGKPIGSDQFSVEASSRELAILEEGNKATIDDAKWTIIARNEETRNLALQGFRVVRLPGDNYFDFGLEDPVDLIKKELVKWRDLRLAIDEIYRLKAENKLLSHLNRPEPQKKHHRNWIQDESPYYGNHA